MVYKNKNESDKKRWQKNIDNIISQGIFYTEEEEDKLDITFETEMLLQRPKFRQHLINEIINTKKSISGVSNNNLNELYNILGLYKDSLKKLNAAKWHIKAKGIQELAIMEQKKYGENFIELTDNANELVRNEAQCGMISLYGLPGLHFLTVTLYPISQWQQIQLLNKLIGVKPENFNILKKSMQSSNTSVIIFSLKLAAHYNCYEVYENVFNCLQNECLQVKMNALEYLKKVPRQDTPGQLIKYYPAENKVFKLAVLEILGCIGNEDQISFLLKQLQDMDDDIKIAAAKSLSQLHPMGAAFLQTYSFADKNPWKTIFLQIKSERVA